MAKVLFFIPTLEPGGAERACLNLINNLQRHRALMLMQVKRGALLNDVAAGMTVLEMFGPPPVGHKAARRKWRWRKWLEAIGGAGIAVIERAGGRFRRIAARLGCGRLWRFLRRIWPAYVCHLAAGCSRRTGRILVRGGLSLERGIQGTARNSWTAMLRLLRKTRSGYHLFSLLWQARRLAIVARHHGCDAVTSFITLPNIIAIIAKRLFHRGLKVIINVHDVTSRILVESGLDPHERVLLKWLVRRLYPKTDMIVAVAEGIRRDLVEHFGVPAGKIIVVNNPIDIGRIRAQAVEPVDHAWFNDKDGPIVVAVGRLVRLKGYDLLIRAFARLSLELKTRLVFLGEGAERPRLEQLIEQHGLKDRVALLGYQENAWKYMARADMLALSSLTEGLPNVIGEAMALDLPVLATDCSPGVREYLQDGENGILVPPGDVAALAQGMERLICDRQLRTEMARRSRERIESFDLRHIVRVYEDVLARVIAE